MEFIKKISNDSEGTPVLEVRRKIDPVGRVYQINLKDLWLFSEEHNSEFQRNMFVVVSDIYKHLGVGDLLLLSAKMRTQVMGKLAGMIQEAIDDVLSSPNIDPSEYKEKRNPIGEIKMIVDGKAVFEREIEA